LICKCGHPDYCHHDTTQKCNAVIQKLTAKFNTLVGSGEMYTIESEIIGDCKCVKLKLKTKSKSHSNH
jgi:hypothetical protein